MLGVSDDFTCAHCGGTFMKAWSDEEAQAEAEELFEPDELLDDPVLVCDVCWNKMRTEYPVEMWRVEEKGHA